MQINGVAEMEHRDAEMPTKTEATFTSVACGYGLCKLKTFAVTSDGTLCSFGAAGVMERLVSLETPAGYAVSVTEAYIAVGGASSVVRLFDPTTLEYRATLPFPPALGTADRANTMDNRSEVPLYPEQPHRYPTTIAVRVSGSHVVALYSDRSIFIYDVSDLQSVRVERSFLFHCGGVRDMKVAGRPRGVSARGKLVYEVDTDGRKIEGDAASSVLPNGSFVTCSDDNTVRIWHLDLHKKPAAAISRFEPSAGNANVVSEAWKNPYSQEMLAVIYHDSEHSFEDEGGIILGGCCSHQDAIDIHSASKDRGQSTGLRAVAIRPDQKHIAAGDSEGNIIVAPLPIGSPVMTIGAHNAEVHSVAYAALPASGSGSGANFAMASGGRDRLVQVYDCSKDYAVTSTLENHSGAVTTLKFANDGSKLLSGGADKTVVFSDVSASGKIARINSVPFNGGKIFDFDITSDRKMVLAACNNRLDMLALNSSKHVKSHHVGEQHHIDVSPANFCVAVSGSLSDKTIHVIDLESGETLASATGHGEAVTSVRFTPDCRRLLSSSNDGCIFVWRLSEDIQSAIKSRLPRIVDPPAVLPSPPKKTPQNIPAASILMPPPPPSLAAPKVFSVGVTSPTTAEAKPETVGLCALAVKGSKKKPTREAPSAVLSTPVVAAEHAGNSEPKQPSGDWRGKFAAAPGPMSNVPMEDWMKTRDSAKKTAMVAGSLPTIGQDGDGGAIIDVDRSQTPEWARTAIPTQQEAKKSGLPTSQNSPAPQLPRGKWGVHPPPPTLQSLDGEITIGNKGDVSLHSTFGGTRDNAQKLADTAIAGQRDNGELENPDVKNNDLLGLSVDSLVTSSDSSLRVSTSLALEREQLEKRQKQIETAKAVAAMNIKLSQLGILKAGSRPEERRPSISLFRDSVVEQGSPSSSVTAATVAGERSVQAAALAEPEPTGSAADSGVDSNSEDDAQSIGYDSSSSSGSSSSSESSSHGRSSIYGSETTESLSFHAEEANRIRPDIPQEMLESIDLQLSPQDVPQVDALLVRLPAVDQSLSVFTQGFTTDKAAEASTEAVKAQVQQHNHISVDCSLSAFSSGYARALTTSSQPLQTANMSVMTSLSAYTAGYEATQAHNAETTRVDASIPVDCSISVFTAGYATNSPPKNAVQSEPIPPIEVGQSISAFTSGYTAAEGVARSNNAHQSINIHMVAASLSSFTAGYESSAVTAPEERFVDDSSSETAVASLTATSEESEEGRKSAELQCFGEQEPSVEIKESLMLQPTSESGRERIHPEVMQSLSSFTVGYEASAPAPVTVSNGMKQPTTATTGNMPRNRLLWM
jgi:WD40 repeat protein